MFLTREQAEALRRAGAGRFAAADLPFLMVPTKEHIPLSPEDLARVKEQQLIVRATEPPPEAEQVRLFITHGHGSPKPEMVLRVVTLPGDVWLERFDLESLSWVEDSDTVNAYVMKGELPARESTPDEVRAALRTLLGRYDAMGGGA
jgi:hypothetical protein